MDITLKDIIRKYFHKMKDPHFNKIINTRSKLAGIILGEMYDSYKESKDKNFLIELKTFIDLKNPLKHLINILDNSSYGGLLSIEDAIMEEYKLIVNMKDFTLTKMRLLDIINEVKDKNNYIDNNEIVKKIIESIAEYRIQEKLNDDVKDILLQLDSYELILKIVESEDVIDAIATTYSIIDGRKISNHSSKKIDGQLDMMFDTFKKQMSEFFRDECGEIHNHLDHVGKSTYESLESIKEGIPLIPGQSMRPERQSLSRHNRNNY